MATTQNTFTGDGSNLGPFSFTFKWLESTDIKVTVAGVLKTAGTHYNLQSLNYSTKTGGQVLFTAGNAPANGAAIVIYRQTDDTDLASTFYSGSAIRAQDLNNNFVQGLYVTQESSNNAAAATAAANAATTTANTALSNSTAAQASAASAISTANSAVSTANSAVSTANSAVSTANSASAAAASAVSTANTANSTASSALSAVSEALAYTTVANVAAIPGSPTNGDSLRITDSTGIESFTPIVGVPVGFVGNSALTVEIYYNGTSSTWVWSRYFPNDPENRYWSGSVIISDTAPLSPTDDSLWYDSIGGRFYIRYNDGNTSQWVDASPQGNRTSTFQTGTAALPGLTPEGDTDTGIYSPGANQLAISTGGSERFRCDSSGRLLVGTSSARTDLTSQLGTATNGLLQVEAISNSAANNGLQIIGNSAAGWGGLINLAHNGGSQGTNTLSGDNTIGGAINFLGNDGNGFHTAATIECRFDGAPANNSMPGKLSFYTTASGASSPTERMRIGSDGQTLITAAPTTAVIPTLKLTNSKNVSGDLGFVTNLGSNCNNTSSYHAIFATGGVDKYYVYGNGTTGTPSDINLKKNIETTRDGYLEDLCQLRVVKYNWNEQADGEPKELGVIAQELEQVFPGLIQQGPEREDGSSYKSVKTSVLPFMLLKALQEAAAKIETLENQNASQAATIASFEARLTALEGGTN